LLKTGAFKKQSVRGLYAEAGMHDRGIKKEQAGYLWRGKRPETMQSVETGG
jgi:hypothetical protein